MAGDTSNTLDQFNEYRASKPAPATCPNCGYCPHCGRGSTYPVPAYPPSLPWYPPPTYVPVNPWYVPQITYTCGPTFSSASVKC